MVFYNIVFKKRDFFIIKTIKKYMVIILTIFIIESLLNMYAYSSCRDFLHRRPNIFVPKLDVLT